MTAHVFRWADTEWLHHSIDYALNELPLHAYVYEDGYWCQVQGTHAYKLLSELDPHEVPKELRAHLLLLT
jgi:hypothetical protein